MSAPRLAMADFDYELPPSAIAHVPADPRDSARLLVDRGNCEMPRHRHVFDLPMLLEAGDVLVVNETRVMPARLRLRKRTGGAAEVLLLAPLPQRGGTQSARSSSHVPAGLTDSAAATAAADSDGVGGVGGSGTLVHCSAHAADADPAGSVGVGDVAGVRGSGKLAGTSGGAGVGGWAALVKPSRRIADGAVLVSERDPRVEVTVGPRLDDQSRLVEVRVGDMPLTDVSQASLLKLAGEAPLPPYIDPAAAERALAAGGRLQPGDAASARRAVAERYQTVYARCDGAVAAPTAGLHLTERVLAGLRARGVGIATVDLTVGLGTFAPVTAAQADDHQMHAEHFRVPAATLAACDAAERVIAVGTTTVRALESAARRRREHAGVGDQPTTQTADRPTGTPTARGHTGAGDQPMGAKLRTAQRQHRVEQSGRDLHDIAGTTDLFLRRGSEFLAVDALLTNFHLPRSSLLLLIDAFIGPRWRDLYRVALAERYRFLSFGDAMLLWRGGQHCGGPTADAEGLPAEGGGRCGGGPGAPTTSSQR